MQFLSNRKLAIRTHGLNPMGFFFSEPEVLATEDSHPPYKITGQVNGCIGPLRGFRAGSVSDGFSNALIQITHYSFACTPGL